jgi:hypothetical protein
MKCSFCRLTYGQCPPDFAKQQQWKIPARNKHPIGADLFEDLRGANPDTEHVFLGKGERIKTLIKACRSACVRAGIRVKINGVEVDSHVEEDGTYRGFLFHDLAPVSGAKLYPRWSSAQRCHEDFPPQD